MCFHEQSWHTWKIVYLKEQSVGIKFCFHWEKMLSKLTKCCKWLLDSRKWEEYKLLGGFPSSQVDDAQCLECPSTSNTDQRLDRGQEFALKTDDSLFVKLTCWELQVGQYTARAESMSMCQIAAKFMPCTCPIWFVCAWISGHKHNKFFPFQKL